MGIQLDQSGVRGKFPLVNYYMGDSLGAFLRAASFIDVTLPPYNCDPSGSRDSTLGIQQAISDLGAIGGVVYLPGTFLISSTLPIGNGASGVASTRNGVVLLGAAPPQTAYDGYTARPSSSLVWAGSNAIPMIQVLGPLQGWGVQNLLLDGSNVATTGIQVISAQGGDCANLHFINLAAQLQLTAWAAAPGGFGEIECMHNNFRNLVHVLPNVNGASGISLLGNNTWNSAYNRFDNVTIIFPTSGTNAVLGILMGISDSNVFTDVHAFNGTATMAVLYFDYSFNNAFPSANTFFGIDTKASALIQQAANNGSPGGQATPNAIFGLMGANGATDPQLANLIVYTNSGQVTGLGTFTNWTPTFTSSGGTIGTQTLNFARYTQAQKLVQFYIDVSITSAGSSPTGEMLVTTPVTAKNQFTAGALSGQLRNGASIFAVTGFVFGTNNQFRMTRFDGTSTDIFTNGNRIIVSGMYEAA